MKKYIIYALVDPTTGQPRYIGKSSSGLSRPRAHFTPYSLKTESYKNRWLRPLIKKGLRPEIVVLYSSSSHVELNEAEIFWIASLKSRGFCLTNSTDGGEGHLGRVVSQETRQKMREANTGRRLSAEVRQRMSDALKGRPKSQEHRSNISKALVGHEVSAETRDKMRRPKTPEHKQKMREANLGKKASAAARAKMSASHKARWKTLMSLAPDDDQSAEAPQE